MQYGDHVGQLRKRWRSFGAALFARAMSDNLDQIADELSRVNGANGIVLDLGCGDGTNVRRYSPSGAAVYGIEMSGASAIQARARGIHVIQADLNESFPWKPQSFDAVSSNQVIEHLYDTDKFLEEAHRVLRPGGLLIVSTENLSSWHNIAALTLGWQAFSLSNVSRVAGAIGNPMANMRGEDPFEEGWHHLRLFSYRGLAELVSAHGFEDVRVQGSGYYPLPSKVGHLDARHAAFITASATRKP
jgi:SAM-dependent methyltransferase